MLPIFKKLGFILMFITYTCAWTQLSFYGNLYIGSENKGTKSINYIGLIPLLIEALIEQQNQIERLKKVHLK